MVTKLIIIIEHPSILLLYWLEQNNSDTINYISICSKKIRTIIKNKESQIGDDESLGNNKCRWEV